MTVRDAILPALDRARGRVAALGLRPFAVAVRTTTWSGARPGEGAPTTVDLALAPAPKARALSQRQIAASAGRYEDGDFAVGPITPAWVKLTLPVQHAGTGTGAVTPSVVIPAQGVTTGAYAVVVAVLLGGAVGVATFRYSTDGGITWSGSAPTAPSVAVPGLGVALAFAGTFVPGDTYSFPATAGGYVPAQLAPRVTSRRTEVYVVLTGPGEAASYWQIVGTTFDRALHYTLVVRRTQRTP